MKKFISLLSLLSLMALPAGVWAQITSLSDIRPDKTYLLENSNGYGYCVYNPQVSTQYLTLGGALKSHPGGMANPLYEQAVDPKEPNNQWRIERIGEGEYTLKNVGQGKYLTNRYILETSWTGEPVYAYYAFQLTDEAERINIYDKGGNFLIRVADVVDDIHGGAEQKYMCAASWSREAVACWEASDEGSTWRIVEAQASDAPSGPTDRPTVDDEEALGTVSYFTLNDGNMVAFPHKFIEERTEQDGIITLHLVGDTIYTIGRGRLASEDTVYVGDLPVFESFKFNNKFNDQLFTDALGTIDNDSNTIHLEAAVIGKRLVPSFQVPDGAHAYVNGKRQISKKTSQRFDRPLTYTLAYPKNFIYKVRKVSDAIYETPDVEDTDNQWISTKIDLTADMLSTNAPSNYEEDPDKLLDGDTNTFFHSTWGSGQYQKLTWFDGATYGDGLSEWPYLQMDLPESIYTLKFSYTTRSNDAKYAPKGFMLQGSKDGVNWEDAYELTPEKDNLPTGAGETYVSPVISLGDHYNHLRLQLTAATYKNYLVMSELSLYKVEENPEYGKDSIQKDPILIQPAVYENAFVPFGRDYKVSVDFKTDRATSEYKVPVIRINTYDGTMITSKDRYWDASFELDGAGVWDDIRVDSMLIKGRGNSSWSYSSTAKNPYRLKFATKIKPFGLTKGKNWVLLANKQTGSMTTNAIAMKLADMVETRGCNHIIPVELYINGDYRGSYNFTEKVGFANNSISLDDESNACMLELDSYYDEQYKFRDAAYNLPVNIQEPDFSDPDTYTNLTPALIQNSFNRFTNSLFGGTDYTRMVDVEALVRAWFVNDFVRNQECKHPKSWKLYNEDILGDSLWQFGPVWDFDWSYGYDGTGTYFVLAAEEPTITSITDGQIGFPFFYHLMNYSTKVKKEYYRLWTQFLRKDGLSTLLEWCDDYQEYANPSFLHNATKWSDGRAYATQMANAKNWLTKRANYIYQNLTPYDLGPDLDEDDGYEEPQVPNAIDVTKELRLPVDVYTISGVCIKRGVPVARFADGLMPGIYIVGGRKVVVR